MGMTVEPSAGIIWQTIVLRWWIRQHKAQECFGKLLWPQSINAFRNATWASVVPGGNHTFISSQKMAMNSLDLCPIRWEKVKTVLWSDNFMFQLVFGKMDTRISVPKTHCYQQKVQKPPSVIVWWCIDAHAMGDLHILWGVCWDFRDICSHQGSVFSREVSWYSSKTMPELILHMLEECGLVGTECVCLTCSPHVFLKMYGTTRGGDSVAEALYLATLDKYFTCNYWYQFPNKWKV